MLKSANTFSKGKHLLSKSTLVPCSVLSAGSKCWQGTHEESWCSQAAHSLSTAEAQRRSGGSQGSLGRLGLVPPEGWHSPPGVGRAWIPVSLPHGIPGPAGAAETEWIPQRHSTRRAPAQSRQLCSCRLWREVGRVHLAARLKHCVCVHL